MGDLELANALAFLREPDSQPVPKAWVPGATRAERGSLSRLGAVARYLLGGVDTSSWPMEINYWLDRSDPLPFEVASELEAAVKIAPDEVLARVYAALVSGARRRVLGTFFTPSEEVAPMLALWNQSQPTPAAVTDVGAGVGVFTAAATRAWPQAQVSAVDVNPVTLGLLGVRLAQADIGLASERVELVLQDFTTWQSSRPRSDEETRLTLGNPPYTRSQLIPTAMRRRLQKEAGGLCGTRASLSAFITAISVQDLQPSDGLCLLLPAQWLESDYAKLLRSRLLGLTHRRVDLRLAPARLFKDATVDAVVLLVGTERAAAEPLTVGKLGAGAVKTIDRTRQTDSGWRDWFADRTLPTRAASRGRTLSEFATVRRGVATGANSFFVLSETMRESLELPDRVVTPLVRRLAPFGKTVTSDALARMQPDERRWLLTVTEDSALDPKVSMYLAGGVEVGVDTRYLCSDRTLWYDLSHDMFVPDVIITAMSRGDLRIVTNLANAAITNNLYGWKWRDGVTKEIQSSIVKWLRSDQGQAALRSQSRQQGDGLAKLEPNSLKNLRLPDALFQ